MTGHWKVSREKEKCVLFLGAGSIFPEDGNRHLYTLESVDRCRLAAWRRFPGPCHEVWCPLHGPSTNHAASPWQTSILMRHFLPRMSQHQLWGPVFQDSSRWLLLCSSPAGWRHSWQWGVVHCGWNHFLFFVSAAIGMETSSSSYDSQHCLAFLILSSWSISCFCKQFFANIPWMKSVDMFSLV